MDIYTTNPSTQYPTTMFYRTEDGVFDICKGCNMKIKVRGSKSNYPMRRHLASKSHKTLVSVHVSGDMLNPHFTPTVEDPVCREPSAEEEHVLEKPVYQTLAVDDIRDVTQVALLLGEEDESRIPPLSSYEISQVEEKITDFYKTGAQNTTYIEQNAETACKYLYLTRFFNREGVENCI